LILNHFFFSLTFIILPDNKNKENYLTNLQIVLAAARCFWYFSVQNNSLINDRFLVENDSRDDFWFME